MNAFGIVAVALVIVFDLANQIALFVGGIPTEPVEGDVATGEVAD